MSPVTDLSERVESAAAIDRGHTSLEPEVGILAGARADEKKAAQAAAARRTAPGAAPAAASPKR